MSRWCPAEGPYLVRKWPDAIRHEAAHIPVTPRIPSVPAAFSASRTQLKIVRAMQVYCGIAGASISLRYWQGISGVLCSCSTVFEVDVGVSCMSKAVLQEDVGSNMQQTGTQVLKICTSTAAPCGTVIPGSMAFSKYRRNRTTVLNRKRDVADPGGTSVHEDGWV